MSIVIQATYATYATYPTYAEYITLLGAPNRGGGVGGSQPPLNFGWGVEHLSTHPDFEKIYFRGGGGLAPLKLI